MKSKTRSRRKVASLSSYADPAYFFINPKRDKGACRKLAQLCSAVESSIASALMCESGNPLFDGLSLICVRPEVGGARLIVSLSSPLAELDEVSRSLMEARGFFRAHMARDLSRRKVPQISFALIPQSAIDASFYE